MQTSPIFPLIFSFKLIDFKGEIMGENPIFFHLISSFRLIDLKGEIMGDNPLFFGLEINSMVIYNQ